MEEQVFDAVRQNDLNKLKSFLENGTVPATITKSFLEWTLAMIAAETGHLEILKYLVKKEPSLLVKYIDKDTGVEKPFLLEVAVRYGQFDMVKYLVEECNADIFEERPITLLLSDYNRINSIHVAVENGKLEILKYLIKKGNVDLNAPYKPREDLPKNVKYPKSLLFIADQYCNIKIVTEYLLKETNIDVSVVDENGDNILFFEEISHNVPILKFILEKHENKFNLNQWNHNGKTFLHHYISKSSSADTKFIQYLVEKKGANINITDENSKWTSLHYAVAKRQPRTCKCLIDLGINIEAKDKHGDTALHLGAIVSYVDICKVLIQHGANINERNRKGETPLHLAINGSYEKYIDGMHLTYPYSGKHRSAPKVLAFLINYGAIVTQENDEDKTPIDYLISKGDLNGLKYLIRRGIIDINQENKHRETLVHLAAIYNQVPILDYLVRIKKAKISTYRRKEVGRWMHLQSPLHTALVLGHYESSKYLIKHGAKMPRYDDFFGESYRKAEEMYGRIEYELKTGRARRSIGPQLFSTHFQNLNPNYSASVLEDRNYSIQDAAAYPIFSAVTHDYVSYFNGFVSLIHLLFSYYRGSSYQPSKPLFLQRESENSTIEDAIQNAPAFLRCKIK